MSGYTEVAVIDGGTYRATLEAYGALVDTWTAGAAFITFTSIEGFTVTVKGSRVEAIVQCPEDALTAFRERLAAERLMDGGG